MVMKNIYREWIQIKHMLMNYQSVKVNGLCLESWNATISNINIVSEFYGKIGYIKFSLVIQ